MHIVAMEALKKKGNQDETMFTKKIDVFLNFTLD
jgi:hypothetical protein